MAKAIMIQGTMSSAGKSLLVAGLCRIFHQDGYRVAPFKSQNMALNSFITKEGLEMGRAQVMQAEAAGICPHVDMNPILLKPTNDTGSQVIVGGKVVGNMPAREYFQYKKQLRPVIQKAYDRLTREYDILVIEGAGSPAEINLKEDDIVNMGMARMADAPVLLVGDIDRGGVFAQLYGTVELLTQGERQRVKGLIVNKFRGDATILEPGINMLEQTCKIPVVGIVPYMELRLEDEDSLTERFQNRGEVGLIDIAVIRLPRISNFTDFNPWENVDGVQLRYVDQLGDLGHPDGIFLPGTKNTLGDLRWLRQNGLETAIKKLAAEGTLVLGICGGFQMLGTSLTDPEQVEEGGTMRGMELLPVDTVFAREKTQTQVTGQLELVQEESWRQEIEDNQGRHAMSEPVLLEGYEIHMGESRVASGTEPFARITDQKGCKRLDGARKGMIMGTYVHGLFDKASVVQYMLEIIGARLGIDSSQMETMDYGAFKEIQYDKLAQELRQDLDMDAIYRMMNL